MITHESYHGKEIVNTRPPAEIRLAALIPHRDSRKILRDWSGRLFAAGLHGAWSFPWAVPLALISRFLGDDELSGLAHALREQSLSGGGDGKLQAGAAAALPFPGLPELFLFGPALDIRLPEPLLQGSAAAALIHVFPHPVLVSALIQAGAAADCTADPAAVIPQSIPPAPPVSFRAAAVANMVYRPLPVGDGAYSFEWEIGELHWLPAIKNKKTGASR
jgi:hypothetical protein